MSHHNDVHAMWVRGRLSPLAELTLVSFLRHHGPVRLWTYDRDLTAPHGVQIKDANEIIDQSELFAYQHGDARGSFGGFSDVFRARLLWQFGGWWTDMDVTLLSPIPAKLLDAPIVLREHWCNPVVGNLMKFPAGSDAMDHAYQWTRRQVRADNRNWNKPIALLSKAVTQHRLLEHRIRIGHRDEFVDVLPFVRLPVEIPSDWWAMHWCNEMWRRKHKALGCIHPKSFFSRLMSEYGIVDNRFRKESPS